MGPRQLDLGAVRRYAIIDMVAIAIFVIAGELRHGINPFDQPLAVVQTLAVFLLGWVVASLTIGAYSDWAARTPLRAVGVAVIAWIPAVVIALYVRSAVLVSRPVSVVFAAVSIGVGGLFLVAARLLRDREYGRSPR